VNILLAGYDKETGPELYYIDYIATLHKLEKGAFGYGSYFSLSMMDRHYHSGMSVEEAIDLVDKCIMEIRSRLVVAPPNFVIKIVDKDGAREYAWRESVKDTPVPSAWVTVPNFHRTSFHMPVFLSFYNFFTGFVMSLKIMVYRLCTEVRQFIIWINVNDD